MISSLLFGLSRIAARNAATASSMSFLPSGGAEVDVGVGEVGLDADRRTAFGGRLLQLPLSTQDATAVGMGGSVIGLDADCGAVFVDRLLQLPLPHQGVAEVVVRRGSSGRSRTEAVESLLQPALAVS